MSPYNPLLYSKMGDAGVFLFFFYFIFVPKRSKAFERLLEKLRYFMRGDLNDWIAKLHVSLVHRTVDGPLLFLAFINDRPEGQY